MKKNEIKIEYIINYLKSLIGLREENKKVNIVSAGTYKTKLKNE